MRCEICGEGQWLEGLPDWACWDANALPDEVHEWARRIERDPHDGARRYLGSIGSARAAEALRSHLTSDDAQVLALVVSSLGWSGDASDGPALIGLIGHDDERVRRRAMESLAELEIETAVEPLATRLARLDPDAPERPRLIECLAWLRYPGVLSELREMVRSGGAGHRVDGKSVADSLVLVGDSGDRAEIARVAIARLERSAADGYVEHRHERTKDWEAYKRAVGSVAPEEVRQAEDGLSDAARLALTWHPYVMQTPEESEALLGPLVVPRRSIADYTDSPQADAVGPPAKFFGVPEWREAPSWPVGGDGQLLMFYGQLSIDDQRTAYLFTAGPDEWQALGPGSAMVIQPGGECHLPTVDRDIGPRSFDWETEGSRFIRRSRRLPRDERYVVWSDGADPAEYPPEAEITTEGWNKVGGTPVWLQGDDTPGPEWGYVLQVDAGLTGCDRGDGAIFYGWINDAGQGALGWQCH
ncbi:MAG: HEAT repeat domain-containing protein [Pseudolysinimonas sp.]